MITCFHCGSKYVTYVQTACRNVITLSGPKPIVSHTYKCNKCFKCNRDADTTIAPKFSRYGWDVIEYVLTQIRAGKKYREITEDLLKYDIKIVSSQISEMKKRNPQRIRLRRKIDKYRSKQGDA
jgi:hypothetical protein